MTTCALTGSLSGRTWTLSARLIRKAVRLSSCGPFLEPSDWKPTPWNKWEAIKRQQEADNLASGVWPVTWRTFHTGNNCLSTALFREVGGFDEEFKRAEDDELALRLSQRGCVFRLPARSNGLALPRAYVVRPGSEFPGHMPCTTTGSTSCIPKRTHGDAQVVRASQHLALRVLRQVVGRRPLTGPAVHTTVDIAQILFRVGLVRLSMAALSAAYDLSYTEALRRIEKQGSAQASTLSFPEPESC